MSIVNQEFVKSQQTYNLVSGGNCREFISEQTRKNLSQSHKGHIHSQQHKQKISNKLKGHKQWAWPKISSQKKIKLFQKAKQTNLQKYGVEYYSQTQQQKRYMSKRMSGKNNSFYQKKHTQQTKEINRQKHLGKNNVRYGKEGYWKNKVKDKESNEKTSETLKQYYKTHKMVISQQTKEKIRKTNYLKTAKKFNLNNNECIRYIEYRLDLFNKGIKKHKIGFKKDDGDII